MNTKMFCIWMLLLTAVALATSLLRSEWLEAAWIVNCMVLILHIYFQQKIIDIMKKEAATLTATVTY